MVFFISLHCRTRISEAYTEKGHMKPLATGDTNKSNAIFFVILSEKEIEYNSQEWKKHNAEFSRMRDCLL